MSTVNAYRIIIDGKAHPMTVGDLKALLIGINPGVRVVMWSDSEGNAEKSLLEVHVSPDSITLVPF